MEQLSPPSISEIIAFLGTLGTAIASLIAINLKAQKDREITHLKVLQDLQVAYDKDLRERRIQLYMELWKQMVPLARYPEPETLTYLHIHDFAISFRNWYFNGGGLVMPEDTRDIYFDLQDGLRILLQKRAEVWSFNITKIGESVTLNKYLGRPETHTISQPIKALVQSELPQGDDLPESIAAHVRALASKLRTSMTEDILSRRETILISRQSALDNFASR